MACLAFSVLLLEIIEDIAYPEAVAACLVGISRTDTFSGSTYLVLSFERFVCSIEKSVSRHDEMSLLGNMETLFQIMSAFLQVLSLSHKEIRRKNDTITDDIHLPSLEDTGRNRS